MHLSLSLPSLSLIGPSVYILFVRNPTPTRTLLPPSVEHEVDLKNVYRFEEELAVMGGPCLGSFLLVLESG